MRIALAGSGGTGKTVTSNELGRLLGFPIIRSVAREVFERNKATSMESDPSQDPEKFLKVQGEILELQMLAEDQLTEFSGDWIAERTLLDSAAYVSFWAGAMPLNNEKWRAKHETIKEKTLQIVGKALLRIQAKPYDQVYLMPYGRVPLGGDLHRSGDPMYQRVIDMMIRGLVLSNLASVTHTVPMLAGDPTDTAIWIMTKSGVKSKLPVSAWRPKVGPDPLEYGKFKGTRCNMMGKKCSIREGKCLICGATV